MKIGLSIVLGAISVATGIKIFLMISTGDGKIYGDEITLCIFAAFFLLYLVVFALIIMRLKNLSRFSNQKKTQVRNID